MNEALRLWKIWLVPALGFVMVLWLADAIALRSVVVLGLTIKEKKI